MVREMIQNGKDYRCAPQVCRQGLEHEEWSNCYESSEHVLELARKVMRRNDSSCLKLPFDDYVEAQAFGITVDRGLELPQIRYLPNDSQLGFLFDRSQYNEQWYKLVERMPIKTILGAISLEQQNPVLLQVQAPFSLLAYLMEPMELYRKLRKDPDGMKCLLHRVSVELVRYVKAALSMGAKIISIADPCASLEILGEKNYQLFAGTALMDMLWQLEPFLIQGVVHLCPRSSYLLERYGYISVDRILVEERWQESVLLDMARNQDIYFTGHQCIHKRYTDHIHTFRINIGERGDRCKE